MVSFLAAIALATLALPPSLANPAAPLETQSIDSLRAARQHVVAGGRERGLAVLDSLVMSDGATVSMEASGAMEASVAQGVESWNDALGESAFRVLPAGSRADVTVRFVRALDGHGGDVQGMVDATREMSWSSRSHSYKLHAVIYVRDNVGGRRLHPEEVANVVAHECGHLLGLADIEREDRLMGPMVVGHTHGGPAPEEAATVREYRALVRQCYPKR